VLRVLWGGFHSYVWTLWRGDSLLTGALIAVAVRDPTFVALLRANVPVLYAAFIGFLGGAAAISVRNWRWPFAEATPTWLAGLYGTFLLLVVIDRQTLVARLLRNRVLVYCGVTSYGLYMFHEPVSGLVHGLLRDGKPSVETAAGCAATLLALVLTLLVAAASYQFFERPFLMWGHKFKHRKAGPAETALRRTVSHEEDGQECPSYKAHADV
jgi:peptidoglycan/LPS O-acetylase OafA/YrhL